MTKTLKTARASTFSVVRSLVATAALGGLLAAPAIAQTATPPAAAPTGATLTLTVDGMKSDEGVILWTLYNSKASFEAFDPETATAKGKCPIENKICTAIIENVPPGEYAILLAHDVDNDGEINRNPLSDELKGVSNYTSKLWWKPNWDDAKFPVTATEMPIAITVY
jgi:uncharacterized protein (DUF2141 family)